MLSSQELLDTEPETVFRCLFWQESARHFEPAATRFQCTCSREKVGGMLRILGCEEVDSVIQESGHVEIHCKYCNERYEFHPVDVEQLFVISKIGAGVASAGKHRH